MSFLSIVLLFNCLPLKTADLIGFLDLRKQAKQNQRPFCGLLTGGSKQFGWNTSIEEKKGLVYLN